MNPTRFNLILMAQQKRRSSIRALTSAASKLDDPRVGAPRLRSVGRSITALHFTALFVAAIFTALSVTPLSTTAFALEDDRNQSITITADYAELNEGEGTATYQGKVELTQGSLQILSDRIVVFTDADQKVKKVVATGTPASFSQQLQADKPEVVAQANDIEYQPLANKLILSHQAALTQGNNRFEGKRIEYDIKLQILNAQGDTSNTESKQRVKMVLPPPTE